MVVGFDRFREAAMSLRRVKMRAVDVGQFAREFKKEYGDRIEDARKKWNRSIFVY